MKKINTLYISDNYFQIVQSFNKSYKTVVPDDNIFFYNSYKQLLDSIPQEGSYYYNPVINDLYKYPKLSLSKNSYIKNKYGKNLINAEYEPKYWLVKTSDIEEAIVKGSGIIALESEVYEYHSVRLFSLVDSIIGSIPPIRFNLYFNRCPYCEGYETITSYSHETLLSDSHLSPLDPLYFFNKNLVVPKLTMKAFTNEGIFNFQEPINNFSKENLLLYLYGIKGIGLPVRKSKPEERHYWEGLNSYLYDERNKIKKKSKDISLVDFSEHRCGFCFNGYIKDFHYYKLNNSNLIQALKK